MLPPPEIISWSEKYGIPPEILLDRLISHGWDLFAAFVVPVGEKAKLCFCGLNGKAYYKVPWHEEYVTARQLVQHYRPEYNALYYFSNPSGEYMPYCSLKQN